MARIVTSVRSPTSFNKSTANPTSHGNFRAYCDFLWSQVPKYARVISRRVLKLLRFGAAAFPRATSQIRKRLLATVTLNDAHQAAIKGEKWLCTTSHGRLFIYTENYSKP